jgi:Spy/CpxP family protein refolding chaperone
MKKSIGSRFGFKMAVVLLGCIVFASTASAVEGGSGRHHGKKGGEFGFGCFKQLHLTDAQKSGITKIMDKYDPQLDALHSKLREARQQMRTTINNSPFDESQVRKAYQELSPLHENMFVLREQMKSEIRSLLTADQIKTLDEKRENWCERGPDRRDHRHKMMKKCLQMDSDKTP